MVGSVAADWGADPSAAVEGGDALTAVVSDVMENGMHQVDRLGILAELLVGHLKEPELAEHVLTEHVQVLTALHGVGSYKTLQACQQLAQVQVQQSMFDEAYRLYEHVLSIQLISDIATGVDVGETYKMMGDVLQSKGAREPKSIEVSNMEAVLIRKQCFNDAQTLYREALQIQTSVLGKVHPCVGHTFSSMASLFKEQDQHEDALDALQHALDIHVRFLVSEGSGGNAEDSQSAKRTAGNRGDSSAFLFNDPMEHAAFLDQLRTVELCGEIAICNESLGRYVLYGQYRTTYIHTNVLYGQYVHTYECA